MVPEEWNPEQVLLNCNLEAEMDERSSRQLAESKFEENAVHAAMSIIHLALHAKNEGKRLQAAQYVCDRVLGRPGSLKEVRQHDKVWNKIFNEIMEDATDGS